MKIERRHLILLAGALLMIIGTIFIFYFERHVEHYEDGSVAAWIATPYFTSGPVVIFIGILVFFYGIAGMGNPKYNK